MSNENGVRMQAEAHRRFKPYPAYKDSGVEWLGEIPAHWEVKRLKYVAPARISKLDVKPDEAVYVGLEHVESWTGRLLLDEQPETVDSVVASFRAGDVLLGKLRPYLAKVARPDFDGVCTSEILPLRPAAECLQSYLMYELLNAPYIHWLDSLTYGTKMPRVSPDQVANSFVSVPPHEEQRAIAAFLDRETAKIDALVAKKERLIELLQEKRTALISRAVTKGLDPHAPMKDSGVEWLGEIPAHWEVKRLKRVVHFQGGGTPAKDNVEYWRGDIPWVSPKDMKVSLVVDTEDKITTDAIRESATNLVPAGAVLIVVRSGILAHSIPVALAGSEVTLNQDLKAMVPRAELAPEYLMYLIAGMQRELLVEWRKEGATVESLELESVACTPTPLPGLPEQRAIAAFLDRETAKIDALVAKVREAIERLKEYRIALISAAVTGKIDVREKAA